MKRGVRMRCRRRQVCAAAAGRTQHGGQCPAAVARQSARRRRPTPARSPARSPTAFNLSLTICLPKNLCWGCSFCPGIVSETRELTASVGSGEPRSTARGRRGEWSFRAGGHVTRRPVQQREAYRSPESCWPNSP